MTDALADVMLVRWIPDHVRSGSAPTRDWQEMVGTDFGKLKAEGPPATTNREA